MQTTQRSVYTRVYKIVGGFLESLPNDYGNNPTKKYPLLISLHGVGERGNGSPGLLEKVANIGIPKLLKNKMFPASFSYGGKSYSFIVLCPQIQGSSDWGGAIQAVIDYAKSHYRVDEQRIYLTGLSLGGIASWSYSASSVAHGKGLAATLLVTPGTGSTATQLKNISSSQLPIWVTNNTGDPYNSASGATALVNAINKTVPAPPKALLTIFTKSGHDAWTATYDPNFRQNGLSVYEWMLSKSRGTAQPTPTPPVLTANAGANQVITLPINTVTLSASGSKVTSGAITSYAWTKVSGPAAGSLTLISSGLQAKLTGLVQGVYKYQLSIKDSNGSTATASVTVTVNAATTSTNPPTVNAGIGGIITLPVNTFTLNGSGTASQGNTIESYKWVKSTASPAGGAITSVASAKTTVIGLVAGTYVYSLTVTDSRGLSTTGSVTIVVKPATASTNPPTVNAGIGGIITLPVNTFTLNGSGTASQGNTIKSYKWVKSTASPAGGAITSVASAKTTVTGLVAGTYVYSLTVTDSRGLSTTGSVTIVVKPAVAPTNPPIADAGKGGTITLPTNTFDLDASLSKAGKGNTLEAGKWTKVSGPSGGGGAILNATSRQATATGLIEGTYVFMLTVTDNKGVTDTATVTVIVKPTVAVSTPPTSNAGYGGIFILPFSSFELDGFLSKAAAGNTIVSYLWTKASSSPPGGTIASPNSVKTLISNFNVGVYTYVLKVTDNHGASSSSNVIVLIKDSENEPPISNAGYGGIFTLPFSSFELNGFLSKAAPGNTIVSYLWTKLSSSPAGGTIASPTSMKTFISGFSAGTYTYVLKVTDDHGASSSSNVIVTIKAASSARSAEALDAVTESTSTTFTPIISSQLKDGFDVSVSPNPVQSDMNISIDGNAKGKVSLIVYGVDGRPLQQQEFIKDGTGSVNKSFNLSRLPAGVYLVQVIVDGKYKKTQRIVKR